MSLRISAPRRDLIPHYTQAAYKVTIPWASLERTLDDFEADYGLDLDPDFQRPFCWSPEQDARYVEHVLRGGATGRELLFNCPGWQGEEEEGPVVLVDGKQRLRAVRRFLADEVPAFGWKLSQFEAHLLRFASAYFTLHVNDLPTRADVLMWYLEVNDGGTPHTDDEIERVRGFLNDETLPEGGHFCDPPEVGVCPCAPESWECECGRGFTHSGDGDWRRSG